MKRRARGNKLGFVKNLYGEKFLLEKFKRGNGLRIIPIRDHTRLIQKEAYVYITTCIAKYLTQENFKYL